MSAVLLDAMGTLVTFEAPAPRLRSLLEHRHGVVVTEDEAAVAMRAEIAVYRAEHLGAGTRPALDALRLRCATVLRDALPPGAAGLDPAELVATLLDSLHFVAFPEVAAVLRALRDRGLALAVVSNWDVSLHDVLEDTGLRGLVDVVVPSAEIAAAKPDPAPFRQALGRLGVEAGDAWHAGDTMTEDVAGARAAGVRPVLVDRAGDDPGRDDPALAVVDDLNGLLLVTAA